MVASSLSAADYYVAPNGDDLNDGSIAAPLASIQLALETAQAGDHVYVRGGTYYEVLRLDQLGGAVGSPITIEAYNGEDVVIAGMQSIDTTWTNVSGAIWKTTLTEDIWQLFLDREALTLARWPNITQDWMKPDDTSGYDPTPGSYWDLEGGWAHLTANSSWGFFENEDSHQTPDVFSQDLTGAMIMMFRCFVTGNDLNVEQVTSHTAGSSSFTHTAVHYTAESKLKHTPEEGRYYLEGHIALLDAPGEWHYDPATKELSVWLPDGGSPAGRLIEGRNQDIILEINNCQHLAFNDLTFYSGAFLLDDSSDVRFDSCRFLYSSYGKRALGIIDPGLSDPFHQATSNRTFGEIFPANLEWVNCEFANYEGIGLNMRTNGNLVENCYFHNGQFGPTPFGAVSDKKGSDTIIRRCTFHTLGKGNATKNGPNALIEYNLAYNFHFNGDYSVYQIPTGSQPSTTFRYNWAIDGHNRNGVRLDGDPAGTQCVVHHVVSMNNNRGFRLKGDNHTISNLTALYNGPKSDINIAQIKFYGYENPETGEISTDPTLGWPKADGRRGSLPTHGNLNSTVRNIAGDTIDAWPLPAPDSLGVWHGDVQIQKMEEQLRDAGNWDFRPRTGSNFIDAGAVLAGITDGYIGTAPDLGAYEYADPHYWIPGRRLAKANTPVPPLGNQNVQTDADLMWLEGFDATAHRVYFGTDPVAVASADENSAEFLAEVSSGNIVNPGPLAANQVYYWRVDVHTPSGVVTGDVWDFDTTQVDAPSDDEAGFPVSEDSWIKDNRPETHGTEQVLTMRTKGNDMHALLKFNVADLNPVRPIESVSLRLYSADGGADVNCYAVADNSWDELTVHGENAPGQGALITSLSPVPAGAWIELDVSSVVLGAGTYSFWLSTTQEDSFSFSSREGAFVPELRVQYEPNESPYFESATFNLPDAHPGQAYVGTVAGQASEPDGDTITYSKLTGPDWLLVGPDGQLGGTPAVRDLGSNVFTIIASDGIEEDTSSLTIDVTSGFVELVSDGFEVDFGNWSDGGGDCNLDLTGVYATEGLGSLHLRDGSGSSVLTLTQPLALLSGAYSELRINFTLQFVGMGENEGLEVDYSSDGGTTWEVLDSYIYGNGYLNDTIYAMEVIVQNGAVTFSDSAKLRLRTNGGKNNDKAYVDELTISAR